MKNLPTFDEFINENKMNETLDFKKVLSKIDYWATPDTNVRDTYEDMIEDDSTTPQELADFISYDMLKRESNFWKFMPKNSTIIQLAEYILNSK